MSDAPDFSADAGGDPYGAGGYGGRPSSGYAATPWMQAAGAGAGAAGKINPRAGLDVAMLDALFEQPAPELVSSIAQQTTVRQLFASCSCMHMRVRVHVAAWLHVQPA